LSVKMSAIAASALSPHPQTSAPDAMACSFEQPPQGRRFERYDRPV
jgi:hypothetical protein